MIESICGPQPKDFVKATPSDSSYIFTNDPSFNPLNLYDFFGRAATVNSYEECFYYVELRFEPDKLNILDILIYIILSVIFIFGFYLIKKNRVLDKVKNIFLKLKKYNFKNLMKKKYLKSISIIYFVTLNYFLLDYVRTKAVRIPRFIDEYLSLASNYNFFTTADFKAGEFIGGSYSIFLTSGPISAIGGVLAWSFTSNIYIARISNFYWLLLMQLLLSYLVAKNIERNYLPTLFLSNLILVLVPWWQGSLYMIGEFASVILFTNSIFLLKKYRNLSLILISTSVFFGKLLTLLPVTVFYLSWIIINKAYKRILKDSLFLSLPLLFWLSLVHFKAVDYTVVQYLIDLFDFVTGHQSSGLDGDGEFGNIVSSEAFSWNNYELFRIGIIPIIIGFLIILNRKQIDSHFSSISIPLFLSISSIYLWFWLISPTKWMRYSQHFTIMILIYLTYVLSFRLINSNYYLFLTVGSLGLFLDNNKYLIYFLVILLIICLVSKKQFDKIFLSYMILIITLTVDISIPYFEKNSFGNLDYIIEDCRDKIVSEECLQAYENK